MRGISFTARGRPVRAPLSFRSVFGYTKSRLQSDSVPDRLYVDAAEVVFLVKLVKILVPVFPTRLD